MEQTMHRDDVQQEIDRTLDRLMLGRASVRWTCAHEDFVSLEFAAFADDEEVFETVRENFRSLAARHGWKHCRVYHEGANRITVTMRRDGPYLEFLHPPMPNRQKSLLPA